MDKDSESGSYENNGGEEGPEATVPVEDSCSKVNEEKDIIDNSNTSYEENDKVSTQLPSSNQHEHSEEMNNGRSLPPEPNRDDSDERVKVLSSATEPELANKLDYSNVDSISCYSLVKEKPVENGVSNSRHDLLSDAFVVLKEYEYLKTTFRTLQDDFSSLVINNNDSRDKNASSSILTSSQISQTGQTSSLSDFPYSDLVAKIKEQLQHYSKQLQKYMDENTSLLSKNEVLVKDLKEKKEDNEERINSLNDRLKILEQECMQYKEEAKQSKEKLIAHDAAAKRAITSIQNECSVKVSQVTKMYEDAIVEKDGMLIKISKLEGEATNAKKKCDQLEKKNSEIITESERLKQQLKEKDIEYRKCQASLEGKDNDVSEAKSELAKTKEEANSTSVKIKWAQNKLKQELESHKETKKQVTSLTAKLKEAKEEGEQIRIACQEMIKQYQDSEEMKSVQLDHKLKETENAVKLHEHEIAVQDEAHRMKTQELEALKASHRKAKEKILEMQSQISSLEDKYSESVAVTADYKKQIKAFKEEKEAFETKLTELTNAQDEIKRYDQQVRYYQTIESNLRGDIQELETELKTCKQKESELLTFSEKLVDNNAQAMTSASNFETRVTELTEKNSSLIKQIEETQMKHDEKVKAIAEDSSKKDSTITELSEKLNYKEKVINELSSSLEDAQDEVKVVKRKNAAALKDLQRQLHQSRRKMEQMESNLGDSQENLSTKSRTSSNCSLDKISNCSPHYSSNPSLSGVDQTITEYSIVQPSKQLRGNHVKGEIDVDKTLLVERICKLQKAHAKKNDKLEFLEEHINTLVEEVQRKNRIIHYYIEREEAGTLAPNRSDKNKAEISRKGGIMASVYSSRPSDKDMTLELSLEINRKLQAVLEDTLLKNITLKESISTLGEEISKLQQEKGLRKS